MGQRKDPERGCDCDPAEFRRDKGAVNMDVMKVHKTMAIR